MKRSFRSSILYALIFYGACGQKILWAQNEQNEQKVQHPLQLEEAIRIALENNYALAIARDEAEIASNARQGARGKFLPTASADLEHGGAIANHTQARTSVGASVDWVVFEGFQSSHGYQRLQLLERTAQWEERQALETLVENVVVAYYDIVQQKQRLAAISDLIAVSLERSRLAQAKLDVGAGSKLEQLQSLASLNEDSSAYLKQTFALGQAQVRLNQILARDAHVDFTVADSIPLEASLPLDEWQQTLAEKNSTLAVARTRKSAAHASVSEARGLWWPKLRTGVAYRYHPDILNSPGNASDGVPTYGISLSIPLFDGLATPTTVRRAKLGLRREETSERQTEATIKADFEISRQQYEISLKQVGLEARNLQVSRLQADAAQDKYRLGASASLEFRDAMTRLLDAEVRFISARQSAKQAEVALQRLAGVLVARSLGNPK